MMSLGVHMLVDDPLKVLIVAGKGRQKPNHKTAVICAGHNSESPHHTQRESDHGHYYLISQHERCSRSDVDPKKIPRTQSHNTIHDLSTRRHCRVREGFRFRPNHKTVILLDSSNLHPFLDNPTLVGQSLPKTEVAANEFSSGGCSTTKVQPPDDTWKLTII